MDNRKVLWSSFAKKGKCYRLVVKRVKATGVLGFLKYESREPIPTIVSTNPNIAVPVMGPPLRFYEAVISEVDETGNLLEHTWCTINANWVDMNSESLDVPEFPEYVIFNVDCRVDSAKDYIRTYQETLQSMPTCCAGLFKDKPEEFVSELSKIYNIKTVQPGDTWKVIADTYMGPEQLIEAIADCTHTNKFSILKSLRG